MNPVSIPRGVRLIKKVGINVLLLLVSALLFSLSFPSFISRWGWFPIAFIALVPVFVVVHRSSWIESIFYGFIYGYGAYALFNYWLLQFHPLAHIIVPVIYAIYFLILFPALKLADRLFPKYGFLVQICLWMGYEYLRTLGFLGYSYGVLGYSQFLFLPLARIAALTGVWGVSLIVLVPSVFIGNALKRTVRPKLKNILADLVVFSKTHTISLVVYVTLFAAALLYGFLVKKDFSDQAQWRVALIQQNVDPWHGGLSAYRKSLDSHTKLSREAEKEDPDISVRNGKGLTKRPLHHGPQDQGKYQRSGGVI